MKELSEIKMSVYNKLFLHLRSMKFEEKRAINPYRRRRYYC